MIRAFGVVVPAHNEQELLPASLGALKIAANQGGVPPVHIVVVADDCTDATADVARVEGCEVIDVHLRSAGAARSVGFDWLVESADVDLEHLWLCTTDADSRVPEHWFLHQAMKETEGFDAVAGTVIVDDWSERSKMTRQRFQRHYGHSGDDHVHVHGANLGLSGIAFRSVGGFPPLALAEDQALVDVLTKHRMRICRTGNAPVITSARRDWRASGGFGTLLNSMDEPDWQQDLSRHTQRRGDGYIGHEFENSCDRGRN